MISGVRASSIRIEFDLVHDREVVIPLQHLREIRLHVVAEIVEPELVVGGVGHVGLVGDLLRRLLHAGDHHADRQAQRVVDHAHPVRVAPGQIVVHGDHVHAAPGQRVQVDRQRRHQRLAFAGLHLGNIALVQEDTAHQLDVERAQPERAASGFAGVGKGFRQQVVEVFALGEAVAELGGLGKDAGVVERLELRLQCVDLLDHRPGRLDLAIVRGAENLLHDRAKTHHRKLVLKSCNPSARRFPGLD